MNIFIHRNMLSYMKAESLFYFHVIIDHLAFGKAI